MDTHLSQARYQFCAIGHSATPSEVSGVNCHVKGRPHRGCWKRGAHYSFTFLAWICPNSRPEDLKLQSTTHKPASSCLYRLKISKQSCLMHFVRHLLASTLDTPLSRQIFRECIQLLNHLGLVARQHWCKNRCFHFLSASLVICLVLFMYISLREKRGKEHVRMDLQWDRHNAKDSNAALLWCMQPPTWQHTQTNFDLDFPFVRCCCFSPRFSCLLITFMVSLASPSSTLWCSAKCSSWINSTLSLVRTQKFHIRDVWVYTQAVIW